MTRFAKLRELVGLARVLEREAGRMSASSRGRLDRLAEAREYRLMALYLAGRLSDEEYTAELNEVYDARTGTAGWTLTEEGQTWLEEQT